MGHIESYSIPAEDKDAILSFLQEEAKKKGVSKANVVVSAIKFYMKARRDEDRQVSKPLVLPSLAACSVSNGNNKVIVGKQQEEEPVKSASYWQQKAHTNFHVPRVEELRANSGTAALLEYCKSNSDRCQKCREIVETIEAEQLDKEVEEFLKRKQEAAAETFKA